MSSSPSYVLFMAMLRLAMPLVLWCYRRLMDLRACIAAGTGCGCSQHRRVHDTRRMRQ